MDATLPARRNLDRVTARVSGGLRLTSAVWCGLGSVLAFGPPARRDAVGVAVTLFLLWSAGYCVVAWRGALGRAWLLGDAAVVAALCLAQPWLVAADRLPEGVGWVTPVTTVTIVALQLCAPAAVAVPVAAALAVAHLAGAAQLVGWAPLPGLAFTLVLQIVLTALMTTLLRRAASSADKAMARASHGTAKAEAARRLLRDGREFHRTIHDTALATLTMVGSGSVGGDTTVLRGQCVKDLAEVRKLGGAGMVGRAPVDVVAALRGAADDLAASRFAVELSAPGTLVVPGDVADALVRSTRQALVNARQHARTDRAVVTVAAGDAVSVRIVDRGAGFDTRHSPGDRLGVRYSIHDRMSDAGGRATIRSVAGAGTEVELRWPA
ncbi:sensor histidine kinase [Asanoa siamensis]|uniref:Histidine kinase/HSP90-like ATPase domain-containing protein n=1 Tax=Asanoa siamensis TaxID=926357 RepID=A0ABQ4CK64_9ACTN|nr:ATP-binding protein [Asanoa siamensis]GIF71687.1 hypothetical protein Asi02nite_12050 [Asanoa siamensis]